MKAIRTTDSVRGDRIVDDLEGGSVSNVEYQHLNGVTSPIQTQLDGKASNNHSHDVSDIETGILQVARGGTGESNLYDLLQSLSPLTTKGDILARNSSNTIRMPVGPDGHILTSDSSQALGIRWAANEGSGSVAMINVYDTSESTSSTTSTSWKEKLSTTFTSYEGDYLIRWCYIILSTDNNTNVKVRINHTSDAISEVCWTGRNKNNWAPGSGFRKIALNAGKQTFSVDFCSSKKNKSVSIKEVRLFALYLG